MSSFERRTDKISAPQRLPLLSDRIFGSSAWPSIKMCMPFEYELMAGADKTRKGVELMPTHHIKAKRHP